ncbi:hypothetical protein ISU07_08750 [Nocardioides islandensis]|jgi:hypothetical protein|uniref:Uncharacterized protein n=1 Tax=Nocardioides islandensis TaxID=433663 RepID=A0A930YHQ9_9ACTN|nr:hypothetical protein [Nocardioides islandensis]MBF4763214.1 hypothetical protein [Nocardioides islandensis]
MNAGLQDPPVEAQERPPDFWHRSHPTFTALAGFFSGLLYVVLVPAAFVGLLHLVVDDDTTNDLFPLVLVSLAVPFGLVASHRTRRFGGYMLAGMAITAVVVLGVAGLVIWFMVQRDQ